jgi:hypothetical protein
MVVHGWQGLSNIPKDHHQVVYHGYVVNCIWTQLLDNGIYPSKIEERPCN